VASGKGYFIVATENKIIKVKELDESSMIVDHELITEEFEVLGEFDINKKISGIDLDVEKHYLMVKCTQKFVQIFKVENEIVKL